VPFVPFYKEAMEMVLDIEAGPFCAWAGLSGRVKLT